MNKLLRLWNMQKSTDFQFMLGSWTTTLRPWYGLNVVIHTGVIHNVVIHVILQPTFCDSKVRVVERYHSSCPLSEGSFSGHSSCWMSAKADFIRCTSSRKALTVSATTLCDLLLESA